MTRITGTAMLFLTVPWTTWDCNDKTVGLTHEHCSCHGDHGSEPSQGQNGWLCEPLTIRIANVRSPFLPIGAEPE